MDTMIRPELLQDLLDVGIALSSEHDLRRLLTLILSEARRLTRADAGTLYLREDDSLRAEVAQCQTFVERWGEEKAASLFQSFCVPLTPNSIAGAAALTREVINIADVQNPAPGSPFRYDPTYDQKFDYSTHSNLAVPMLDRFGLAIGVLQLINARKDGHFRSFSPERVKLARALASQAGVAIANAQLTESLRQSYLDTLRRLGVAAEWRDKETANHINRVARYSRRLAERLGWAAERAELLENASPMHDVGKVGIPDAILNKPGRLTPEERAEMEKHTLIGADIMDRADNPVMEMSRLIALGHHEKWDGSGYPRGLKGEEIPLECRIVALADVYDALASRRCYKPAMPLDKVLGIIREESGRHFDPVVVEAFFAELPVLEEIRARFADTDEELEKVSNTVPFPTA